MKRRWGLLIGLVVAGLALVPFATAEGQAPPSTAGSPIGEGSAPLGGDVNCTTAPTLDPTHGPPGTTVQVTASFQGNCDEFTAFEYGITCEGTVTGDGVEFSFPFTFSDTEEPAGHGSFVAPATEPNPPVVDAIEPLTVTITCSYTNNPVSPPAPERGGTTTTWHYPPANFDLELFAETDTDQPTEVENDADVNDGVVNATPTFTG